MHYVYLLVSEANGKRFYVGLTSDLKTRFRAHNAGQSPHTVKFRPWKLHWYAAFSDESSAKVFEAYLKTGSGRRFQRRHLAMS